MTVRAEISTAELGNLISVLLSEKQFTIQRLVEDPGMRKRLQTQVARLVAGITGFELESIRADGTITFKVPSYIDVQSCSDLGVWFGYKHDKENPDEATEKT